MDSSIRVPAESREICAPCGNVVMERPKFNTRTQIQGEQFQSFVGDLRMDHFTVVAKLPGLRMEARLPVTLLGYKFLICSFLMLMQTNYNYNNTIYMIKEVRSVPIQRHRQPRSHS